MRPHLDGSLESRTAGLRLNAAGETLRLIDSVTGERLPNFQEMDAARQAAEQRADREAEARQAAEARIHALEEELVRVRAESKD